ncbi:hypothetical protein ACUNV4_23475 [Granulosicoccus sp. 3-233]|uniref:hypothetical protein n=1 Tax=Granulosicoccus sp. 3-233 TaxID=3417969 RepID=UPI003D326BE3
MATGKLDYVYRLSAARLVILRMRLSRFMRRRFLSGYSAKGPIRSAGLRGPLLMGVAVLSGLLTVVWFDHTRPRTAKTLSDKVLTSQAHSRAMESLEGSGSADQTVFTPEERNRSDRLSEEQSLLSARVDELEQELIVSSSENTSLKNLLAARTAENDALQSETQELRRQLRHFEQEHTQLEEALHEQVQRFAEAQSHWDDSNTEHKVIYNITNIPVGTHVTQEQLITDSQNATEVMSEPSVNTVENSLETGSETTPAIDQQSYTYPFGADANDVNSIDPYQQYRDTTGDNVGWKGDDYLADTLRNGLNGDDSGSSDVSSDSDESDFVDEPVEPGSSFLGTDVIRQEPFFGPAPDRYEDLVEPGMAQ